MNPHLKLDLSKLLLPKIHKRSSSDYFTNTERLISSLKDETECNKMISISSKNRRELNLPISSLSRNNSTGSMTYNSISLPNERMTCKSCNEKAGFTSKSSHQQARLDCINEVILKINKESVNALRSSLVRSRSIFIKLEDDIKIVSKIKRDEVINLNRTR